MLTAKSNTPDRGDIITEASRLFAEWIRTGQRRHLVAWSRLVKSAPLQTFSPEARP